MTRIGKNSQSLALASLLFSRGAIAEAEQPGASPNDSPPNGLVVVIENKPNRPLNLLALDNPFISGVALQIHWADIEPTEILGRRFVLQMSDVHAGPGPHSVDSEKEDKFVIGFNGRIITGFQLRTSAERNSGVMGAEGDPPQALKKSINLALEPNEAGKHVNYLEIYEPDVLAEDMQAERRYAASVFAP